MAYGCNNCCLVRCCLLLQNIVVWFSISVICIHTFRLVWVALCLICLCGFITSMTLQVGAYFDYRTSLSLNIVREHFEFPAVTICNHNKLSLSKLTSDSEIMQAIYILSQPLTEDIKPINISLRYVMNQIGPEFSLTYKSCVLKSNDVSCSHLFRGVFDLVTKCYTFNPNTLENNKKYPGITKVERHGMRNGLEIKLDCQADEYFVGLAKRDSGTGFSVSC